MTKQKLPKIMERKADKEDIEAQGKSLVPGVIVWPSSS